MAQVCSVMGEGLGLLPNRALSASVRRPSANDIFLPPRHKVYQEYSARTMAILSEYSPPRPGPRCPTLCSVMGKGLGLLPNRALSASVRRPSANDIFLLPRHRAYREYSARMIGHPLRVQPPSSGTSMSNPSSW
jgi:hypothetical protein